jgi:hypothetical protein
MMPCELWCAGTEIFRDIQQMTFESVVKIYTEFVAFETENDRTDWEFHDQSSDSASQEEP